MIAEWDCYPCGVRRGDPHRGSCNGKRSGNPYMQPKPTFLPLMKRPSRPVEKEAAEKEMRDLLERTRLMLRNG